MTSSLHREPILQGALGLFLERPREDVSLACIGERIGINYWQVKRVFGRPEQVYRAAVCGIINDISASIGQAPDVAGSVRQATQAYAAHAATIINGEQYRRMIYLLIRDQCACPWLLDHYEEKVAGPLKRGLTRTVARAGDEQGLSIALRNGTDGHFVRELEMALVMPKLLPGFSALPDETVQSTLNAAARNVVSALYSLEFVEEAA